MKYRPILSLLLFTLFTIPAFVAGQNMSTLNADSILRERGEVCFTFSVSGRNELDILTNMISIDNVQGQKVTAYANRTQFDNFLKTGYDFTVLTPPSMLISEKDLNMGNLQKDRDGKTVWNFYPTYLQYLDLMNGFATNYPSICKIDTIGTSIQGRLLLAVKISDSVNIDRGKPLFLYTSTIHGDEVTGYVLMLHLIDYLLTNYGVDQRITDMVNNTQIYINPLANPDGTYHGGNNTIYGATRYNAAGIDLNRNFPDPEDGPHPYGEPWQQETIAFMDYADSSRFTMSMNFHGGAEVFNYPWDTWWNFHADNSWFDYLGREYADTVHQHAPSGYMTFMDNGVTRGIVWYTVNGGRQDYMTYFQNGREVTLEISDDKTVVPSQLLNYWEYNYRSFLNYIAQIQYGINGQVTDTLTGEPVKAKVNVFLHDYDNSFVYSRLPEGWYYRPIDAGTYSLTFSAPGYFSKNIPNISVSRQNTTRVDVQMVPLTIGGLDEQMGNGILFYPNPVSTVTFARIPANSKVPARLEVHDLTGRIMIGREVTPDESGSIRIDLTGFAKGLYFVSISQSESRWNGRVMVN